LSRNKPYIETWNAHGQLTFMNVIVPFSYKTQQTFSPLNSSQKTSAANLTGSMNSIDPIN